MGRVIALMAWLGTTLGCATVGRVAGARPDTQFIQSDLRVLYYTSGGLRESNLDGSNGATLFPAKYILLDHDGEIFVLGDENTNLYIARRGEAPRRIAALDHRCGGARLSPDSKQVAAVRHANFSLPQSLWTDDDTVYLIDVDTLEVRTMAGGSEMPTTIAWESSGAGVWVRLLESGYQRVNIADGTRQAPIGHERPSGLHPGYRAAVTIGCTNGTVRPNGDLGLELEDAEGNRRQLVTIVGHERSWFHDYRPLISRLFVTPDCDHVVFTFDRKIWVVEIATGHVGRLATGWDPVPLRR